VRLSVFSDMKSGGLIWMLKQGPSEAGMKLRHAQSRKISSAPHQLRKTDNTVKLRIDGNPFRDAPDEYDAMAYFMGTNFWIRVLGGPTSVTYKLPLESSAMRSTKSN
jgi:hypothetical protein